MHAAFNNFLGLYVCIYVHATIFITMSCILDVMSFVYTSDQTLLVAWQRTNNVRVT